MPAYLAFAQGVGRVFPHCISQDNYNALKSSFALAAHQ
jgi:hypothetical protein